MNERQAGKKKMIKNQKSKIKDLEKHASLHRSDEVIWNSIDWIILVCMLGDADGTDRPLITVIEVYFPTVNSKATA